MAPKKTSYGTWAIRGRDPRTGVPWHYTFKKYEIAKNEEIRIKSEQQAGTWVDPNRGKMPFREMTEDWNTSNHHHKPSTKRIVAGVLAHINAGLGGHRSNRIDEKAIDDYLEARLLVDGAAPGQVHLEYRTLKTIFKWAHKRGKLPRNPMALVNPPYVPDDEMMFLTPEELWAQSVEVDKQHQHVQGWEWEWVPGPRRYRSLVLAAGTGGFRWGETAGMGIDRLDVAGSRLHVVTQLDNAGKNYSGPKAKSRRWVEIPRLATDMIVEDNKGRLTGLIWTTAGGGPLVHTQFRRRVWCPAADRTGLGTFTITKEKRAGRKPLIHTAYTGVRWHDLRHTAVALAIKAGAHPKAIQMRMGHSSIRVTLDIYGHLWGDMDHEIAVALNDMLDEARPAPTLVAV